VSISGEKGLLKLHPHPEKDTIQGVGIMQ